METISRKTRYVLVCRRVGSEVPIEEMEQVNND